MYDDIEIEEETEPIAASFEDSDKPESEENDLEEAGFYSEDELNCEVCNELFSTNVVEMYSLPLSSTKNGLMGTGIGADYGDEQLRILTLKTGEEVQLFRAMCDAEYISIINNDNKFVYYEWAMEVKWFATCTEHVKRWGKLFYPDGVYKVMAISILKDALKYMLHVQSLDGIGPAYAADIELINKIIRKVRLI